MMKKNLTALAFLVGLSTSALAQSSPGLIYGQVPTAAQWNSYFTAKQDYLGAPPCIVTGCTMTGKLTTAGSATSGAGFNLPPGAAPTSPVNGDFWSTSAGFFGRAGGVTYGPFVGGSSGTFAGTSPITVSFPAGVVTYAFDFTVANTFLAQQTDQGATTTSPGWYVSLTGDTQARVRVGLNATDVASIAFGPGGSSARDAFVERVGAGSLRLGAPDAASPVPQVLGVQNVITGTLNTAGANLTINGSQGTGTGCGGSIIFQTAAAGGSGSTPNSLAAALTLNCSKLATFAGHVSIEGVTSTGATGTGNLVFATSSTIASLTVTGAFTATGLVTNNDLVNASTTVNGQVCTLGTTCTVTAAASSIIAGTTTVTGGPGVLSNASSGGVLVSSLTLPSGLSAPSFTVTTAFTATGLVTLADIATQAANTVLANGTGSSASLTAFAMSSCSGAANALQWLTNTGFQCGTITAAASSVTVGTTMVGSSTDKYILYNNGGTLGNYSVTGTGTVAVMQTSPSLVTPALGVATATSVAIGGCTIGGNVLCATGTTNLAGATTVASASFGLSGNISAAAWTTSGVRYKNVGATLTDTSSSGIVATAYTDLWGGNTIAASSATTFTNYYAAYFVAPTAGSNVTLTNKYALGADSFNATTIALGGSNLAGANPSATAGPSAVNGSAVTYMRSDAAPAIQKASNSQFGIVEVDGTTITASGGIITAVGGVATSVQIGVTTITSGSSGNILYNNAGVLGELNIASAANFEAGTANKVLDAAGVFTSETTTTYGATTTFDMSTFIQTKVTLTGNITTVTFSNIKAGQCGNIRFIQDGTGSRTLPATFNANFKFPGGAQPVLSTAASAVDNLGFCCSATNYCVGTLTKALS